MMIEKFKKFLADYEPWDKPFSDERYSYYCNGFIVIRTKRDPRIPFVEHCAKSVNILNWPSLPIKDKAFILPPAEESIPWEEEPCAACNGTGLSLVCPECEGAGIVAWETEWHKYNMTCQTCWGEGKISAKDSYDLCHNCQGTGNVPVDQIALWIDEVGLSNIFLKDLMILPDLKFLKVPLNERLLYFTFNGGDGMVVGRKEES